MAGEKVIAIPEPRKKKDRSASHHNVLYPVIKSLVTALIIKQIIIALKIQ